MLKTYTLYILLSIIPLLFLRMHNKKNRLLYYIHEKHRFIYYVMKTIVYILFIVIITYVKEIFVLLYNSHN